MDQNKNENPDPSALAMIKIQMRRFINFKEETLELDRTRTENFIISDQS